MSKVLICIVLFTSVFRTGAQAIQPPPVQLAPRPPVAGSFGKGSGAENEKDLPRFDLDFAGGTPQELVDAIRAQIGTLNAIIPEKDRAERIPAFNVKGANVAELFRALQSASQQTHSYQTGFVDYGGNGNNRRAALQWNTVVSGFQTVGAVTPEAVWYYSANSPPSLDVTVCRFYQLAPYLGSYKVDDITTAIQAGWKMLGDKDTPKLNYHEDTKLLIAVGTQAKLEMIDAVLSELKKGKGDAETPSGPPASKDASNSTKSDKAR